MTPDREETAMPRRAHTDSTERELAFRANDGVEVALLWCEGYEHLIVEFVDTKADDAFRFEVAPTEALDAFHHPYAYAAFRGIEYAERGHLHAEPTPA
jgi:hypothetical protein